jgi:hypothetical protein
MQPSAPGDQGPEDYWTGDQLGLRINEVVFGTRSSRRVVQTSLPADPHAMLGMIDEADSRAQG